MAPKKAAGSAGGSPSKTSHASRAAALLSKARAQASSHPAASTSRASTTASPTKPSGAASSSSAITLPELLKTLSSKGGLTMRDAMAVAGKLINARANTPEALAHISLIMLQDIGVESEEHRKRAVLAFKGKRAAGFIATSPATTTSAGLAPDFGTYRKRRRADDDETLGREYGNVTAPSDSRTRRPVQIEYTFNEVLEADALRGRYAVVNRAPAGGEYGGEYLNKRGYELYAEFRPSTAGEWGKKGRLWYDKILALRRGCEAELREWNNKQALLEQHGPPEEEWAEDVERLVQEELDKEQAQDAQVKAESTSAKQESEI
ncbi:hypothetical protein L1887_49080 [Cichorium endivia]|nr:hypothetical protein L1887_49080 [Cichorium endivia]